MKLKSKLANESNPRVADWISDAEASAQEDELIQALLDEMNDPQASDKDSSKGPTEFIAWSC